MSIIQDFEVWGGGGGGGGGILEIRYSEVNSGLILYLKWVKIRFVGLYFSMGTSQQNMPCALRL